MQRAAQEALHRARMSDSVRVEKAQMAFRSGFAVRPLQDELGRNDDSLLPGQLAELRRVLFTDPPPDLALRDKDVRARVWDTYGSAEVLVGAGYGYAGSDATEGDVLRWNGDRERLECCRAAFDTVSSELQEMATKNVQRAHEEAIAAAKLEKEREMRTTKGKPPPPPRVEGQSGQRIKVADAMRYLLGGEGATNAGPVSTADTERDERREEDLAATSIIAEITSLVDFISELRGEEGLVSKGRKERHRLLEEWKRTRDIKALHDEKERRSEEIRQVQQMTGRSISSLVKQNKE
jgi:hypothetical protein